MSKLLLLSALAVALVGCGDTTQPTYTDETAIPKFSSTAEMGEKYPYIIVDEAKLEYDNDVKWYFYAGTRVPALWVEFDRLDSQIPDRTLYTTSRTSPSGVVESYVNGKWVEAKDKLTEEANAYLDGNKKLVK